MEVDKYLYKVVTQYPTIGLVLIDHQSSTYLPLMSTLISLILGTYFQNTVSLLNTTGAVAGLIL